MNKLIKVSYNLYTIAPEGKQELVERAPAEHPFQFISGLNMTLDGFEAQIEPLAAGAEFDFTVPAAEAYGDYLDERVVELAKENFCVDGRFDARNIYPGNIIPLVNEDGNRFNGIIKAVGEKTVTVDLNHPCAGNDLRFKGSIVESREATASEVEGMLNMMSGEDGCDCCGEGGCGGHGHGEGHGHGKGGCCGGHGHGHGHGEGGCCGGHGHGEGHGHGHGEGGCCGGHGHGHGDGHCKHHEE